MILATPGHFQYDLRIDLEKALGMPQPYDVRPVCPCYAVFERY